LVKRFILDRRMFSPLFGKSRPISDDLDLEKIINKGGHNGLEK
jgi:hypothetical protein